MVQKVSPFVEAKYGWAYGSDGWNTGVDENFVKFSALIEGNIDGVVSSLPAVTSGQVYFLTTDNRLYFSADNTWYSSPCPINFTLTIRDTGDTYQFDGVNITQILNSDELLHGIVTRVVIIGEDIAACNRFQYGANLWNLQSDVRYVSGLVTAIDEEAGTIVVDGQTYYMYKGAGGEALLDAYSPNKDADVTTTYISYTYGDEHRPVFTLNSGTDDTEILEKAIHHAQNAGVPLNLGAGNILIGTRTITCLEGKSLRLRGDAKLYAANVSACDLINDQGTQAHTLLRWTGDGSGLSDISLSTSCLELNGIFAYNCDTTVKTRVFYFNGFIAGADLNRTGFYGFSCAGRIGLSLTTEGIHPNSDAVTTLGRTNITNSVVVSDTQSTGSTPKSFHIVGVNGLTIDNFSWDGNNTTTGNGYVFRIVSGGGYDVIPRDNHGAFDIKITNGTIRSENYSSEYCQIAKARSVFISGVLGITIDDGVKYPDNLFDLFNCQNVIMTNCGAIGGGLVFHGHADLGGSSYPANLIPPSNLIISDCWIHNPSHYSVINLGGDGSVGSNRAFYKAKIRGITVTTDDDYTPPQDCYFLYAFLANDITIEDVTVDGLHGYFHEYYCKYVTHDNIHLIDVPDVHYVEGGDSNSRNTVGFCEFRGTTGSTSVFSSSNTYNKVIPGLLTVERALVGKSIGGHQKATSSYSATGSASVTFTTTNDATWLRVYTMYEAYGGESTNGNMYDIRITGSSSTVVAASTNVITGISVTVTQNSSTSWTVTATNTSGTQRTLFLGVSRVL